MKKLLSALCFSVVFSAPVFACSEPANKPEIPDPKTAVTAQMVKSNNEVKEYVKAQEDYLNCAKMSSREKRVAEKELVAYADEFNSAIREFKLASN